MENQVVSPDFSESGRISVAAPPKEMLTVERDGAQTTVRINSSSLSIIQTCPRKALLALKQGWKPRSGSPALVFGSAIHKALEAFYRQPRAERGEMPPNFEEEAQHRALHGHQLGEHWLFGPIAAFVREAAPLQALPSTDKRSIQSGVWLLSHYFRTYMNDIYVIASDKGGPLVERTVSARMYEDKQLRIDVFGTIDFILRNEATGEVLPGDHKTTSQMGSDFLNRIKPNHQYTGYAWLAEKCLGIQSENFLVNGIQVKAKPVTARGGPPTFVRQITRRTQADYAEFFDAVDYAVRSYLAWDNADVWPIGHVDACAQWGACTYLDVCSAPNELRNNILEANFAKT